MTDSRTDADVEPAGDDARRPGRGRSGGSGRGRPGARGGFGEGGRGRGSRRRDTAPESDPGGAGPPEEMADPEAVARDICLRALTGAARTRQQLAELLDRKDVPPEAAEAVLDRLTEVGLVDDAAFAAAWVSSRQAGRGLARRALAAELRAKGVDGDVAAAAVAEVDPQAEWDAARQLVARRAPGMRRLDRVTAERRLVAMLARKGYGGGLAAIVVREALDELSADGEPADGTPDPDEDRLPAAPAGEMSDGAGDATDGAADALPAGRSRSGGFGRRGSGLGSGARSGGGTSSGFGAGGFGGRKSSRRVTEGKSNGSGLGGGGGISGQRAASMADEVGEGHWEPIARRTEPPGRRR